MFIIASFKSFFIAGVIGLCFVCSCVTAQEYRRLGHHYSRWSVELDAGIPMLVGNLTSLSADKKYIGICYGGVVGFQLNRAWGFSLSLTRGENKVGARDYASGFLLGEDGHTYYFPQEQKTYLYQDIYSDINFLSAGVRTEINMLHLFRASSANRFSFLLIPGVYVHQFSALVKEKGNDTRLFPRRTAISFGAGIDGAFRFRLTRLFDLQLRSGITWITDNDFIGFSTPVLARYNYMWNSSVGLIFKIPERGKRGHIMYAPRNGECYWL